MNNFGLKDTKDIAELTWVKKFKLNLILTWNIYNIISQSTP